MTATRPAVAPGDTPAHVLESLTTVILTVAVPESWLTNDGPAVDGFVDGFVAVPLEETIDEPILAR